MLTASEKHDLARRVYATSHLNGDFVLRSGATSSEYFDKYRFESDPMLLREIAVALATMIPDEIDFLAGLELGGVPIATALAQVNGTPAVFVRKSRKPYGTRQFAEGADIEGRRIVVIEDVISSGGQAVESCAMMQQAGAVIDSIVCVIDRQTGGAERIGEAGFELRALFTMDEMRRAAE